MTPEIRKQQSKKQKWRLVPVVLGLCLVLIGSQEAPAHRRQHLIRTGEVSSIAVQPRPFTLTLTPSQPQAVKFEAPDSLLQGARSLESKDDLSGASELLLRFINLFPQHPDRSRALTTLAKLAEKTGQLDKAWEVYTLTAVLYSGTRVGAQARFGALRLELVRGLTEGEKTRAFRHFLENLSKLLGVTEESEVRHTVEMGWQAVVLQVGDRGPHPLSLLEEVLALWDLTPAGLRPPAAGLLVSKLLKEKGLLTQGEAFLPSAAHQVSEPDKTANKANLDEGKGPLPVSPDTAAFSYDRLGLKRLKDQRLEEAKEAFQVMANDSDQFWQLLARTRLTDLELKQQAAELSP